MLADGLPAHSPMAPTQTSGMVTDSNVTPVMLHTRARLSGPPDGILRESGK